MIFRLSRYKHAIGPTYTYLKLIQIRSVPKLLFKSNFCYSTNAFPPIPAQQIVKTLPYNNLNYKQCLNARQFNQNARIKYKAKIKWNVLLRPYNKNISKLIKNILAGTKLTHQLFDQLSHMISLCKQLKNAQKFILGLLTIAIHKSDIPSLQIYKQQSLQAYLQIATSNTNLDKNFVQNQQLQNQQQIIIQICQYFIQRFNLINDKQKRQNLMELFHKFLMKQIKYISKISALNRLLSILCELAVNIDSQRHIFNFGNVIKQLDHILKIQLSRNQKFHFNRKLSPSQFNQLYPSRLYANIFKAFRLYSLDSHDHLQYYMKIIGSKKFQGRRSNNFSNMQPIYRQTYAYQCSISPQHPIMQQMQKHLIKFQHKLEKYSGPICPTFFILMLVFKFYNEYLRLSSFLVDGYLVHISKPNIPQLTNFQYKFYKIKQKQILQTGLAKQIMLSLYPGLINKQILDNIKYKDINKDKQKLKISKDNEYCIRMSQTLQHLNLKYDKKLLVNRQNMSFMLSGTDIVIQCDKTSDNIRTDVSMQSGWRNMIMLLSGYRLIIINQSQIINQRSIIELSSLIIKKLQIMNDHQAYLVE